MSGSRQVRYVTRHAGRRAEVTVVEIDAAAGLYDVTVDGHTRRIEWKQVSGRSEVSARFDDRFQFEFAVHAEGPERRAVDLAVGSFTVDCVEALIDEARASAGTGAATAGEELLAPIPGRVVKVTCEAGQAITAGQPLVILEAMKMQNELRATGAGVVLEVCCAEGDTVNGGATLVRIGPPKP